MLKILRVGMLDNNTLDVHLSNGNIMLFNLDLILNKLEFRTLLEDDRALYPKTDGICVYWQDGPKLTVDDIINMMGAEQL